MEDDNLLDEEILVQETQDVSPTVFSRNLINRLGFSSQQHGTETVSLDNGNNSYKHTHETLMGTSVSGALHGTLTQCSPQLFQVLNYLSTNMYSKML